MEFPFDVMDRSKSQESLVIQKIDNIPKRKYYGVRYTKWYGGGITAYSLGCNLLCAFCYNVNKNKDPIVARGSFYTPDQVVNKIVTVYENNIKKGRSIYTVRISGTEAIMGDDSFYHLFLVAKEVINKLPNIVFIVETNGILLGLNSLYAKQLSELGSKIFVRVCIKGTDSETFEKITGGDSKYYKYQYNALQYLKEENVNYTVATFGTIVPEEDIEDLGKKINLSFGKDIEIEPIIMYGPSKKELKERNIL